MGVKLTSHKISLFWALYPFLNKSKHAVEKCHGSLMISSIMRFTVSRSHGGIERQLCPSIDHSWQWLLWSLGAEHYWYKCDRYNQQRMQFHCALFTVAYIYVYLYIAQSLCLRVPLYSIQFINSIQSLRLTRYVLVSIMSSKLGK